MSWVILFLVCPIDHGKCVEAPDRPTYRFYSSHELCEREKHRVTYRHAIPRGFELVRVCEKILLKHVPATTT